MSWANQQQTQIVPAKFTSVAGATEAEYSVFTNAAKDIRILRAAVLFDTANTCSAGVGAIYSLVNEGSSVGTGAVTMGTWQAATATALFSTLLAFVPYAMAITGSLSTVSAGEVITLKKGTLGTGTVISGGQCVVEYMIL